jgi:hypothetical protein
LGGDEEQEVWESVELGIRMRNILYKAQRVCVSVFAIEIQTIGSIAMKIETVKYHDQGMGFRYA